MGNACHRFPWSDRFNSSILKEMSAEYPGGAVTAWLSGVLPRRNGTLPIKHGRRGWGNSTKCPPAHQPPASAISAALSLPVTWRTHVTERLRGSSGEPGGGRPAPSSVLSNVNGSRPRLTIDGAGWGLQDRLTLLINHTEVQHCQWRKTLLQTNSG